MFDRDVCIIYCSAEMYSKTHTRRVLLYTPLLAVVMITGTCANVHDIRRGTIIEAIPPSNPIRCFFNTFVITQIVATTNTITCSVVTSRNFED